MDVNEVDYIKIGQRIRAARMELGWQQAEVAFRAGLTTSHMSHIETGQTKVALPRLLIHCLFLSMNCCVIVWNR